MHLWDVNLLTIPQPLMLWYFACMETNILRCIFFDENQHWEAFKEKYGAKIRPVVKKEVEKFRDCGNLKKGVKLLVCEGCHDVRKVPYRCKGRFCTTCSVGESEEWSRFAYGGCIPSVPPPRDLNYGLRIKRCFPSSPPSS